jgi:hypothetical protein
MTSGNACLPRRFTATREVRPATCNLPPRLPRPTCAPRPRPANLLVRSSCALSIVRRCPL